MATENLFSRIETDGVGVAVLHQLKKVPVPERPALIAEWCATAAAKHAEEEALRYYAWLILAVREACALGAEYRLACMAADLYAQAPAFRESTECIDPETYATGKLKHQTLAALKKHFLIDIVLCWAVTKDEGEATHLSAKLLRIAKSGPDQQALDRLCEAFQEAMKKHVWPKARSLAFLADVVREVRNDELAKKVLLGVMRTLRCAELDIFLPVLAEVPFDRLLKGHRQRGGGAMLAATARDAAVYRRMDDGMCALHALLPVNEIGYSGVLSFEPSYPSVGQVELEIAVGTLLDGIDTRVNAFHAQAESVHAQVETWLASRRAAGDASIARIDLRVFLSRSREDPALNRRFEVS